MRRTIRAALNALARLADTGTCDASADTGFTDPVGPCILRNRHDGPVHMDANGAMWRARLDTDPPPAGAPGHESAARALLAGAIRICECGILTAGRGPCDHVSRCGSCGQWTPRATPDTSPPTKEI